MVKEKKFAIGSITMLSRPCMWYVYVRPESQLYICSFTPFSALSY